MIAVKFLEKLHIVHQICSLLGHKESLVRRSTIITMENEMESTSGFNGIIIYNHMPRQLPY